VATEIIADNLIMLDKRSDQHPEEGHETLPGNENPFEDPEKHSE
jgi:hypothetical protein